MQVDYKGKGKKFVVTQPIDIPSNSTPVSQTPPPEEMNIEKKYKALNEKLGCDFTNSLLSIVAMRIKNLSDTHACQYIGELSMGMARANPWLEEDYTQCLFKICGTRMDDVKSNFDESNMSGDILRLVFEDLLMALGKDNPTVQDGVKFITDPDMLSLDRVWHGDKMRLRDRANNGESE